MELVVIGVCTARRPVMLESCLRSLIAQDLAGADFRVEVAVIDNEPQPNNRAIVERLTREAPFPIRHVHVPMPGLSNARNGILHAAAAAGADFIAMLDDDETADPEWISRLMARPYRDVAVAMGRRIFSYPEPEPYWLFKWEDRRMPSGTVLDEAYTYNVRFSADLLRQGLRFDDRFNTTGGEDKLFFLQARKAGFGIVWIDDAITYETMHPARLQFFGQLYRDYAMGAVNTRVEWVMNGSTGARRYVVRSTLGAAKSLTRLVLSPLGVLQGRGVAKRRAMAELLQLSRRAGVIVGYFGKLPTPYAQIDGH